MKCTFNPLGFGSTHTRLSPIRSSCNPSFAFGRPNAPRYAPTPSTATTRGRYRLTFSSNTRPPSINSSFDNSSAAALARATTLEIPYPHSSNSFCSDGFSSRGVTPPACNAGQNRFPGLPKWCPTAAVYNPGLIPTNSIFNPGAITSSTSRSFAASNSAFVGRRFPSSLRRSIASSLPLPTIYPMTLPYLTTFPGIGGVYKQRVEDFHVAEIPLYEPAGTGEHVYAEIQKAGLTTFAAIHRIAKALNINARDIGYAGLKDAQAVTRQIVSIQGTTEDAVRNLAIPDLQVLWAARHNNKLRLGHLKANRFLIKLRDVNPTDVVKLQPVIDELQRHGMPNYFGEQRFGMRKNNHLLGAALLAGDNSKVLHLLLGSPDPAVDDSQSMGARKAFDNNDFELAMRLYPRRCGLERRVLHRFRSSRRPGAAVREVDEKLKRLWISATQSEMFNQVVARRIGTLDTLIDGDLAWKHDNGACFPVESVEQERPRAAAFEISASGPLVGYRMTLPRGEALAIEQAVMSEHGLAPESFRVEGKHRIKGARRPLRVRPEDVELASGVDEHGPHVTLAFTLPAGSFATVLLREIMKTDEPREAEVDEDDHPAEAAAGE